MANYRFKMDVLSIVADQLPRTLVDKVQIDVQADAYLMSTTVVVKLDGGRKFESPLEPMEVHGTTINLKIPEQFLAQLCVLV